MGEKGQEVTIREARQFAAKWQETLRLNDWRMHIRWRKSSDDEDYDMGAEIEGCIDWFTEQGIATIVLRRDASEHTIVHELIHLLESGHLSKPLKYDASYERAINILVDALMREPELGN